MILFLPDECPVFCYLPEVLWYCGGDKVKIIEKSFYVLLTKSKKRVGVKVKDEADIEVLIPEDKINERVCQIAQEISEDYEGKEVLLVGILKGAVIFMADIARKISLPVFLDFMAVSSYGSATRSSGAVQIIKDIGASIEGKNLIVVEDIVDSGLTLKYLLENLSARGPASLKTCVLLDKPEARKVEVQIDYKGFEIPDDFVVGYGLDYAQKYRNLPYIGVLKKL